MTELIQVEYPSITEQTSVDSYDSYSDDDDDDAIDAAAGKGDDVVFVSYNRASESTVLQIRDRLKAASFAVSVDVESIGTLYHCRLYALTQIVGIANSDG